MDWNLAGAVILSGLVIVFLILGILICVVAITGRLSGTGKSGKAAPAPAAVKATASVPAAKPAPAVQAGISGETVAVISAAVAALMDEQAPGMNYAVTGIRRKRFSRPVWGFAGMQQNTRPF